VDDEPDIGETTAVILETFGIPARTARDGREALAVARSDPPAVILLDLRMPVMGGEQFLAARQDDSALAAIPVVVCSANTDPATRARLRGVAAYLLKPADPAELVAEVRHRMSGG
jgi:CheY-like chemotaxis protein